MKIEIGNF